MNPLDSSASPLASELSAPAGGPTASGSLHGGVVINITCAPVAPEVVERYGMSEADVRKVAALFLKSGIRRAIKKHGPFRI